jgi:hypothetical protein
MSWYLTKIIYRIICGEGDHTAQFDEQLRLIKAENENEAIEKAMEIGKNEQETFYNNHQQLVQWKFVNVPEIYEVSEFIDGAEIYSRIHETDDAFSYLKFVTWKADLLKKKQIPFLKII